MKVLIVEEHPERERISLSFLREAFVRADHEARLTNAWSLERDYTLQRPDIVVDNVSVSAAHFVGKLGMLGPCQRNVNLMWEQLPVPAAMMRYSFGRPLSLSLVDGRVAWGLGFKELLCEFNPEMDSSRVGVVGSMKHSALRGMALVPRESWAPLYGLDLSSAEKVVLVAESFPNLDEAIRGPRKSGSMDHNALLAFKRYGDVMRAAYIRMVNSLATDRPDWLFVVRGHPSRANDHHAQMRSQVWPSNVVFNSTGDVGPLISMADIVLASNSGVLLDSWVVGKPAIDVVGKSVAAELGLFTSLASSFSQKVGVADIDVAALEKAMVSQGNLQGPEHSQMADRWIGQVGEVVFDRVVEFVEKVRELPSTGKSVSKAALVRDREIRRRWLRNRARMRGMGRSESTSESFPYDTVCRLLRDSGFRGKDSGAIRFGKSDARL